MVDLDEILDDAESADRSTRTVRVCVKPSVAVERARLLNALEVAQREDARDAAADERLSAPAPAGSVRADAARAALAEFEEEAQKALLTIRFTRMDGNAWALLTSANPMRIDIDLDRQYGYNYDVVSELAARATSVRLDDDGEHPISDAQWDRLFRLLAGFDVEQIRDAVWTLNEWEPSQHVEALVKGFGAA